MFHIGRLEDTAFTVPHPFQGRSYGYARADLIERSRGSVHMAAGIGRLDPGGETEPCLHAFEKGIYVLSGVLQVRRGDEAFELRADEYALIPHGVAHALRNAGALETRWFEMDAPQPKRAGGWEDTIFQRAQPWPIDAKALDAGATVPKSAGRFEAREPLVPPGGGIRGLSVFRFMEREFGAHQFFMMRGELLPGGARSYHDHPIEEFYFALSGEAYMDIEGQRFHLTPGSVAWTGVGTCHAFCHTGSEPFRWLETQAPQFPARNGTRNYDDWETLRARESA